MKKYLPIILILLGILIISIPTITNYRIKKISQVDLDKLDNIKVNKQPNNINIDYDFDAVDDVDPKDLLGLDLSLASENTIGFLFIPSINLSLPILEGTTSNNLFLGATTMRPDQVLGVGNYPLAGHYMKDPSLLFGGIMDININDKIYITDKDDIYVYTVIDNKIVPDSSIDFISNNKIQDYNNKAMVSLMTCYYSSQTGKRFFSMGQLEETIPYSKEYIYDLFN